MSATVFDTALDTRSLVEASAGTGKTWALAGLFARAVIVGRLRVPQVLAVTYTVAATQELHERVRVRLREALELSRRWHDGDSAEQTGDKPETALLRRLLHMALQQEPPEPLDALRLRLARATREMDLAAITTIHGFCQRLLAEHALAAGQSLVAAELVPGNAAQRNALAVALWRQSTHDVEGAGFLRRQFGAIDRLAEALRDLLAPEPLLPPAPVGDALARREQTWATLHRCFIESGTAARQALHDAMRTRVLSSAKDKRIPLDELWEWFERQAATSPLQPHQQLARLGRAGLATALLKSAKAPPPELALCDAVDPWLQALEACDLQRLHALRTAARMRDAANKRATHTRDYDDLVSAVHAATCDPHVAPQLAADLRAQYPLVLVDEFQDTDARQWAIFERLFADGSAGAGGLLLVGDPKQAIYRFRGGDVETYLRAHEGAAIAAPLRENFRSRPCLLATVNALFERAPDDALGDGIDFAASEPGGKVGDADYLHDDTPAPALSFHHVPARDDGKDWNKPESIRIAAGLCAEQIRSLLQHARDGHAQRRDRDELRALQPRDCAVLVRTHDEGLAVRIELARRGVPAVSAGRGSLFATEPAQTLLALLLALAAPGDERRLRALLATPLFGLDAAALCALEDDGEALRRWQQYLMQWRLRWERYGPQAMLAEVVARQAPLLLARNDGERDLTHLLHLGELMQEARASALDMRGLGLQGQIDWLRAAIAHADGEDERQWPRLESDAGRVQILTLHAAKGLEFPLVFLPFAGIGRVNRRRKVFVDYHDAGGTRVRQWKTAWTHPGAPTWGEAEQRAQAEESAEDMRLLYVGLTRAREALWLCGGALAAHDKTALSRLLGGNAPSTELAQALADQLVSTEGLPRVDGERLLPLPMPPLPPARTPRRTLRRDWWIHSFSQLHRQQPHGAQALVEDAPADDERTQSPPTAAPVRFGGTRFGNALHQALEHVDFARWRDLDGAQVPDADAAHLVQALRAQDYPETDLDDGVRELAALVTRTLNTPLPLDDSTLRLCELPTHTRIAELEFHFTLVDADGAALLALLHRHDIARDRRSFGAWPRMSGLMTGKIDLALVHGGRMFVLDYKSNLLPGYAAADLDAAMRASEYDLQALLYAVALHRWMRLRRGAAYDPARDFGGALYLFCRGLDAHGGGIASRRFPPELLDAVDALLAPDGGRL